MKDKNFKSTLPVVVLMLLLLGIAILSSSCTTQQRVGVRGIHEVKHGKHYKLTKGAKPACLNAW